MTIYTWVCDCPKIERMTYFSLRKVGIDDVHNPSAKHVNGPWPGWGLSHRSLYDKEQTQARLGDALVMLVGGT